MKIQVKAMIPYLTLLDDFAHFCDEFKVQTQMVTFSDYSEGIPKQIPNANDANFCLYPQYQAKWQVLNDVINIIMDVFEIDYFIENKQVLSNNIVLLAQPNEMKEKILFELNIHSVRFAFDTCKQEISKKLSLLYSEEKNRLNEALNCYINGCYYSAVAMSVSAVEFRLYSLMKLASPESKLEKFTLGALIDEYLKNKEKYNKIIPEKHEHLLNYSNIYRIFSVHPKKEKITKLIATSILYMSFSFLFDEELKNKAEGK
jgi:hypothetical protein